jgi:peptidoglycan/xylan/chitin deacetylase (PgdA/CDA1 family)
MEEKAEVTMYNGHKGGMTNVRDQLHIFVIMLSFFFLLGGCQVYDINAIPEGQSNTPEQEQAVETVTDEPTEQEHEKQPGHEPLMKEENDQREPEQKYVVHPKNFMIYPVLEEGEESDEPIALLTFDDTPTGDATEQILDTLDRYEAKAIFFVNGHYAIRNLDWLKEIRDRGHLIGNHTWWHIYIRQEDPETVREEIVGLNDFLEEQLGERPVYFRPPFGQNSDVSLQIIQEEGMQTMNWSNGSLDWELKTSAEIAEQVLSNLKSGDNILFHDKQITADALDEILSRMQELGYRFVLPTEVILPEEAEDFSL